MQQGNALPIGTQIESYEMLSMLGTDGASLASLIKHKITASSSKSLSVMILI